MRGEGISLIVPFRPDDENRQRVWDWLRQYWQHALPGAQLVIGQDDGVPFSKSSAVNRAAAQASGDVIVILDADAYIDAAAIEHCAEDVRQRRAWWMPYQAMWRLRRGTTEKLLAQDPRAAFRLDLPPDPVDVQGGTDNWGWAYQARNHGAMCMVVPTAGFKRVGGMDPRFRGWGAEDASFAMALNTIWAKVSLWDEHDIAHLWHVRIGEGGGFRKRMWVGQTEPMVGRHLRRRYAAANGKRAPMKRLIDEGLKSC